MVQRRTTCVLIIGSAVLVSLAFNAPARAKDCGGTMPCACGDNVVASRTLESDPVLKGVCPGTALIMNTPGVSIIFKKKPLAGSSKPREQWGPGFGILISADNVTIQKGRIEGFRRGITGTTNGSRFIEVNAEDNAEHGINITGNGNTFDGSAGSQSRGPNPSDGTLITGNNNVLTNHYSEKSPSGAVAVHVIGSGNFLQDTFVEENWGGGILVEGGGNIDGGGNEAKQTIGEPKCQIDGKPCLP
jgi:hypothetical protein